MSWKVGRLESWKVGRALRRASVALLLALPLSHFPTFRPSDLHPQGGLPVGTTAPAVTINDMDGEAYAFSEFLGKRPALIEFWATWCPLCESLMPQLRAARERYGDELELIGVNVTVNQPRDRVRRYLEQHRPPFRTLWDDRGVAVRAYDVPGTSFVVIVDREGTVAYTGIGDGQDLAAALRKVLGR
jgi:thiol-disulfide isomerase/thioredoxin